MSHLLNVFPLANLNQFNLAYRLIEVGQLPGGKTQPANLQRIRNEVARTYGTPVALLRDGERSFLAVAYTMTKQVLPDEFEIAVLQNLTVHLRLIKDAVFTLNLADLKENEGPIAIAFLGFELRGSLRNQAQLWKGSSAFQYYTKVPLALSGRNGAHPKVAILPGFSYRFLNLSGHGLCIAVDVVHIYTDSRTLAQRVNAGEDWRRFRGRHFVYEFGPQWYPIQLQEVSGHTIRDARFPDPNRPGETANVFEYTQERWRGRETDRLRQLQPTDCALIYNYPGDSAQFQGATSLARLRYKTEDPEVSQYHQVTILRPDQRLQRIQQVVDNHLNGAIRLEDQIVEIGRAPVGVARRFFPVPSQLFGHEKVLSAPKAPAQASDMWRTRMEWLRDKQVGPFSQNGITSQFLLVPMSIAEDEPLLECVQDNLTQVVQRFYPGMYRPTLAIWDDRGVATIPQLKRALSAAKSQMERAGPACAVTILPAGWDNRRNIGKLRLHMKKILQPAIRTKCLQGDEILRYLQSDGKQYQVIDHRFKSYLAYTALDILVTSGYWPFVLTEPFHYDLHIGVDVLNHTAGFVFMAASGKICRFHPSSSEQSEKLSTAQLSQVLIEHLRNLIPRIRQETGRLPRHIVIFRDGRWYETEQEGLEKAVVQLQGEGLLSPDVLVGVVEVRKSNAERLRLVSEYNGQIQNPVVGSYHIFDERTGLICTTGYPARLQGTVEPLVARIVYGRLDITCVLQDIYGSSTLAWSKPDGVQSNPTIIKLADDWLESFAAAIDDNEGAFDHLIDPDDDGLSTRAAPSSQRGVR